MRILISGSTGFLGTALVESLGKQGHSIARLVRPGTLGKNVSATRTEVIPWDPVAGQFDAAGAEEQMRSFISPARPLPGAGGTPRARSCCGPAGSTPHGTSSDLLRNCSGRRA